MAFVVVERDLPEPAAFEALHAMESAARWCFEMYDVTFVRSYLGADGRRMICLYEARDAESVRMAQRKAGLPVSACYPARVYPEPASDDGA